MFVRTCVCVRECVPTGEWEREKATHKRKDQIFRIFFFFLVFFILFAFITCCFIDDWRLVRGERWRGGAVPDRNMSLARK